MTRTKYGGMALAALAGAAVFGGFGSANAKPAPPAKAKPAKTPANAKTAVTSVVKAWEAAYARKDKRTMLTSLMMPTQDANAQEKRSQWLRGYGPKDLPGSKHPPILFETSKGSFVPTGYTILQAIPNDATHWTVNVHEKGTYRDEDGRYKVERDRSIKCQQYKGKWYVADYVLKSNTEDYGFYVDDIADKMTPLGK